MEQKEKKSLRHYMRLLHRDIGFFAIGLIIIYSFSGIVLVYRETSLFKHDVRIEKKLSPGMNPGDLNLELRLKNFKVTETDEETIYFENGTYNKTTGLTVYVIQEVLFPINKFISLHKSSNSSPAHYFNTLFGILLFFLGISSFWMFKSTNKIFGRGILIASIGIIFTILILFI